MKCRRPWLGDITRCGRGHLTQIHEDGKASSSAMSDMERVSVELRMSRLLGTPSLRAIHCPDGDQ